MPALDAKKNLDNPAPPQSGQSGRSGVELNPHRILRGNH